ncbi:MAG: ABC-F type ribosomal protection protein [Planctomycetaceae bacterium]|jgi:lincosamide and streptogramin A transport system ATP-binding/permease protein|nr:ABC-F type ribosomal protection protein [Planctomycetaceae bacterium]
MAIINIVNMSFAYDGGTPLFSNISLKIDTHWKLGLIGRNGRGKTTLLRLLLGDLVCDGKIDIPVPVGYFPYTVQDKTPSTLEIAEQITNFELWQFERELSLLEVSGNILMRPFETLSDGEQSKVMLAVLFLNDNHFLLIDEPTNHLDLEGRNIVGNYLNKKNGFILVSHDRTLLDRSVDHILSINRNSVELMQGNFSTWQCNQNYREQFEDAENNRLKKEVRRLQEATRQSTEWSNKTEKEKYGHGPVDRGFIGSKAAKIMKHAKSIENRKQKTIEQKQLLFKNTEITEKLSIMPIRFHSTRLIDLENIFVQYNDGIPLFDGVTFSVEAGDRVAVCGRNGCGKSSLLKLIAGQDIPYQGYYCVPKNLTISYLPQNASFLRGSMRDFIIQRQIDESLLKTILHKLGFPRDDYENDMSDFSAGQKKKVLLAASLCEQVHLYLWDEPLNYIDIISRTQIMNLLIEYHPTLIFVEHDKIFLETIATKKIDLLTTTSDR